MTNENPFADPAVMSATASQPAVQPTLDDYNPFDPAASVSKPSVGAAVLETTAPPPPYTPSGHQPQRVTSADFERRQEELERRAEELERREAELKSYPSNIRRNNWPPLPSCIPIQPCFYQDINVDIPVEFQQIVKYLYYLWLWHVGFLLANLIVGLIYMFVDFSNGGTTFGLAIVYFCIFTPASFICWFRPAYKAFRSDSSFNFMIFFFVFFFQAIVSVLSTMGISNMGSCGLISAIGLLKSEVGKTIFVGVLMLFTTLGFGIAAAADIYLLLRIHKLYRSTGASLAKAQAEFTNGVMSNDVVRQATADAASAGFHTQFGGGEGNEQPQSNAGNTGGIRY